MKAIILSRLFIPALIILILSGCSSSPDQGETQHRSYVVSSNPTRDSIHFYTIGEMAFSEGDLLTAYGLFNQADLHDPTNLTIKERIMETLWILSREDNARAEEMIRRGEDFQTRKIYSADILRYLGMAYFQTGQNESGLQAFEKALKLEPSPYNYYDYFLYLLRYGNRLDFSYLEKALEKSEQDRELIYAIAQIYEHHDPSRSKAILEQAAREIDDEESHERLIDFYRRYGDWESLVTFIQAKLDEGYNISREHRLLQLDMLFFFGWYHSIAENYQYYRDKPSSNTLEKIFFAAYYAEEYAIGVKVGKELLDYPDYPDEKRELMLASLAELNLLLRDYRTAADYFIQVDNLDLSVSLIYSLYDEDGQEPDMEYFIDQLIWRGYDHNIALYLRANAYLAEDKIEEGLSLLHYLITRDIGDELKKSISVIFLTHEQEDAARQSLLGVKEEGCVADFFIGSYYYIAGKDSLAIAYLKRAMESQEKPSSDMFLTMAALLERNKEHEEELRIMEQAISLYPDDPLILNWYGYSLVVHTTRYAEAEEYLLKAIELEPDSYFIQDSVAWLYYKLEDYDKALSYMEDIIYSGVEDTVIAYHIGMIYYKLRDTDSAKEYILRAIELSTNEDYVIKSEKILKELNEQP